MAKKRDAKERDEAPPQTLLICCGALAREVVALVREQGWQQRLKVEYLPAKLHMDPESIPEQVRRKIRAERDNFDDILVFYGDCGTGGQLDDMLEEEGVERIEGAHCYEIYAGSDQFKEMMQAEPGSFFLSDFLARHFERLVWQGLALDRFPQLRDTYFGNYRKVVYLAQTEDSEMIDYARRAADMLGLEFEMRYTGIGGYRDFLEARIA